ncbi:MAG: ArnT family glycosyltransferase, partial [Anaerolineae bacterium]
MNPTESRWLHTALFIIVLLTAGGLRFTALDSAPPGLTHDEADHGLDAAGVLAGVRPIYFTVGYGREPLYDYSTAAARLVVGENFYAGRITAGLYGMSLLVLTYLLVRHWSGDKWLALAAVGAMAISFWTVSTSRQALRSITLPVTYTLAALLMLAGWRLSADTDPPTYERAGWGWFVLAGLALGAMAYTYLAARIMWGVFPALFIALAVTRRGSVGKLWPGLALMLGVGAVTAAPLAVYLLNNPAAEARVGQLSGPLDAFLAGDPAPLLVNIRAGFGMVTFSGDDLWLYNIPGRP